MWIYRCFCLLLLCATLVFAQGKAAQFKAAAEQNRAALSRYTWKEHQTLDVDGETRKKTTYEVQLGADGQPQRKLISEESPEPKRTGPLRRRLRERKVEEFKEYATQVMALVQAYGHPDSALLQKASQAGNISEGDNGEIVLTSYLKPGDSMTVVLDAAGKQIQSVQVQSYLEKPDDKVTLSAQYQKLADGTSHLATAVVNGESRNMTLRTENTEYRPK